MPALRTYLRRTSWPIIVAMLALMTIGVLAIRVSGRADADLAGQAAKQLRFAALGLAVFFAATLVPYHRVGRLSYLFFVLTLLLLVAVLFTSPVNGSRRWFDLKFMMFQPSELAKLTYILMLAWYLRYGDNYRRFRGLILPLALACLPMGLILAEPDMDATLLLLPTLYFMLFMAGAKLRHLLGVVAVGAVLMFLPVPRAVEADSFAQQRDGLVQSHLGPISFYRVDDSLPWRQRPKVPLAYCRAQLGSGGVYDIQPLSLRVLGSHQIRRVEGWLRQDDPRVVDNEGFQLRWSLVTLASGGWAGGEADADDPRADMLPVALGQLPEDHTDFIFSVIGGRWGFLGCLAVLFLYAVIFVFGMEIASITYDPFGRLLAVGILGLMLSQLFINTGMTMGLIPITGMTLPLLSYGGSSLLVNCAALGLLVNVGQHRPILLGKRPFEYGQRREKQVNIESTVDLSSRGGMRTRNGR